MIEMIDDKLDKNCKNEKRQLKKQVTTVKAFGGFQVDVMKGLYKISVTKGASIQ